MMNCLTIMMTTIGYFCAFFFIKLWRFCYEVDPYHQSDLVPPWAAHEV